MSSIRETDEKFYDENYEPETPPEDSDDEHFSCHARYEQRISRMRKSRSAFSTLISSDNGNDESDNDDSDDDSDGDNDDSDGDDTEEISIAYSHTKDSTDYFSLVIDSQCTVDTVRKYISESVTHVYFSGTVFMDILQEISEKCSNLTHLVFNGEVLEEGIQQIAKKCSKLEYLVVSSSILDETLIDLANGCPNLTHFYIYDQFGIIELTDESVIQLTNRCPKLKVFSAPSCENLTDASLIHLVETHPNLTNLNILGNENVTSKLAHAVAKNCPKLKKFIADHCLFSHDSLVEIAEKCRDLTTVYLYECPNINNSLLMTFARNCPNLYKIDIYNPRDHKDPSDDEMEEVAEIRKLCKYFGNFLDEEEY